MHALFKCFFLKGSKWILKHTKLHTGESIKLSLKTQRLWIILKYSHFCLLLKLLKCIILNSFASVAMLQQNSISATFATSYWCINATELSAGCSIPMIRCCLYLAVVLSYQHWLHVNALKMHWWHIEIWLLPSNKLLADFYMLTSVC